MAIEVFRRYETKFVIDSKAYIKITRGIERYMNLDEYNKKKEFYTISNIYYDTPDDLLIRQSIAKPKYKEKIRLRSYGIPNMDTKVYIEIKKKIDRIVSKRRTAFKLDEAYSFLETGKLNELEPYMNEQVINELMYAIQIYNLRPKVYIAYDRRAYFGKNDRSFRITFDKNIRTRRYDVKLEEGDYGNYILKPGDYVMEVKSGESIPMWFTKLLSENGVYKGSFSKYGTEYKIYEKNKQIERKVLNYA